MGHRSSQILVLMALGGVTGACAAVSGLDQYAAGERDAGGVTVEATVPLKDATAGAAHETGPVPTSVDDATVGGMDATVADVTDERGDVSVPPGDTADTSTKPEASFDAGGDEQDSAAIDASPDASDASDAGPVCGPSGPGKCGGCCDTNGNCVGGQSNTTCGTGGVTCDDCTRSSRYCNAGVCSAAPSDAGACTQSSCNVYTMLCIPFYQSPCCKSDGTCSCKINFPPGQCL